MTVIGQGEGGSGAMTDEEGACRLLAEHLAGQGLSGSTCAVNPDKANPPDLLVTLDDGSQWGVEVTRTYLQVADPRGFAGQPRATGISKSPARRPVASGETPRARVTVSSESITKPLFDFAKQLGEETKHIRKRDYTLSLGPSPADSLSGQPIDFGRLWKDKAREEIREHIQKDRTGILRKPPGVWLKPGDSGHRWTIAPSPGVHDAKVAVPAMLTRALRKKAEDLPRWNGHFARRWLLLLNRYPLVPTVSEVEAAVEQVLRTNEDCRGFDGIFWNEWSDSSLVLIPVSAEHRASYNGSDDRT